MYRLIAALVAMAALTAPAAATYPERNITIICASGAGGIVSNEITLVRAGSTAASALRVNTGQPPTEIQAPRPGYRFVPVASRGAIQVTYTVDGTGVSISLSAGNMLSRESP